jgi:glycosyltransferase involved in cell wall biosynthesis
MRVVVTTDTLGGVWSYTRELIGGLLRRGVQVTLVSFGALPDAAQSAWLDNRVDFRPTTYRLEWMQDSERDIDLSIKYLENVVREVRPDLVHLNQYCYGSMRVDVPRIVVAHSDVLSWWSEVKGEPAPHTPWFRWYRAVVEYGLAGADLVVAPSRWMLDALVRHYSRPRHATVIYNGRDPRRFHSDLQKEDLVVAVGRLWDEAKQVSLLASLTDNFPVVIAGSGQHPDGGSRQTQCGPGVTLTGRQSEQQLASLFARAAIYAGTSRYEPFGLAPLESAFAGCALVLNDIPSFREIWNDAAVYFQRNDAGSLATTLRVLRAAPRLRAMYAAKAQHRARELYTADRMVSEYLQIYGSLVAQEVAA